MNVTIYTKSGCPNCVTAKNLLKALNLEYKEIDVETGEEYNMQIAVQRVREGLHGILNKSASFNINAA